MAGARKLAANEQYAQILYEINMEKFYEKKDGEKGQSGILEQL